MLSFNKIIAFVPTKGRQEGAAVLWRKFELAFCQRGQIRSRAGCEWDYGACRVDPGISATAIHNCGLGSFWHKDRGRASRRAGGSFWNVRH